MTKMKFSIGILAGLLLSLFASFVLTGNPNASRAMAQAQQPPQQPPAAAPRYQLSAWGSHATRGAYILDTQSGKVWQIIEGGQPNLIGTAGAE